MGSCDIVELDPDNDPDMDKGDSSTGIVNRGSEVIPNDSTDILTLLHGNGSKAWEAEEFSISGLNFFQGCRLDDQIILSNDGTYSYDGGEILCGAEDNQRTRSGSWELDFSTTRLIFDKGTALEYSADLITLENETVVLSGIYVNDLFGTFNVEGRYINN
jgi:hypothetical protein